MSDPIRYDETSDTLYMSFSAPVKATGIELNEHILLRLDKEKRQAVGLTFLNYSILVQKADFGPRSFPLTGLANLPEETRALVMEIIESEPIKSILSLSTYTPSFSDAMPIALLNLPQPA